ncbi:MAG TPA: hypothetical protein VMU59_07300 [Caulobacteraceae bacterium]|nr:hypothetical protein [Caulobacteraceae bacterium]
MAVAQTPRHAGRPVLEATKARSGSKGQDVLWVLVVSTGLISVVLLAILALDAPGLSGPGGQVRTDRPTISAPQSPVKQTLNG